MPLPTSHQRRASLAASVASDYDLPPETRRELFGILERVARRRQRVESWPVRIRRPIPREGRVCCEDYVLDLVQLALIEFRLPIALSHRERADWFGVSLRRWKQRLAAPYAGLLGILDTWRSAA